MEVQKLGLCSDVSQSSRWKGSLNVVFFPMSLTVTLILFMVSSCLFAVAVALQFLSPVQSSGCKLECDRSRFGGQNIYSQPCFA